MGKAVDRLASLQRTLAEFVEDLYLADEFEEAFDVFHTEVNSLDFDGVLYTYIPMAAVIKLPMSLKISAFRTAQ